MPLMSQVGRDETCSILHAVIEAGDHDVAVLIEQAAENAGQHADRVLRAAAEYAGMQIAIGGLDLDLVINQAAQRCGNRRRVGIPHTGVADQCEIGLQVLLVGFKKRNEILRADFFLALDHDGDIDRQRACDGLPGPAGFDEGHQLALVVLRAARDDDFSPVSVIGNNWFERRTVPEIERVDRLHIVVTIEQHVRPGPTVSLALPVAIRLGNDGGVARRRPDFGRQTERGDILGEVIGGRLAICREGGIGGDRLDPQQAEQPLQTIIEIGIDAVEDRLKLRRVGHFDFP